MKFSLEPKIGAPPIRLGMRRNEVSTALSKFGAATVSGNLEYFCENAIQVEYEDETVSFIGLSWHPDIVVEYQGKSVFKLSARELFECIASNETERHEFSREEHLFHEQVITLWDADRQYDHAHNEKQQVWAQIGIGDDRYYQAVLKYET